LLGFAIVPTLTLTHLDFATERHGHYEVFAVRAAAGLRFTSVSDQPAAFARNIALCGPVYCHLIFTPYCKVAACDAGRCSWRARVSRSRASHARQSSAC